MTKKTGQSYNFAALPLVLILSKDYSSRANPTWSERFGRLTMIGVGCFYPAKTRPQSENWAEMLFGAHLAEETGARVEGPGMGHG